MDSTSDTTSSSAAAAAPPPTEAVAKREEREKEMTHRIKVIQFLGRTTPIILQNDNGPCPLLAICNVLSLKNSLNLSPDIPEVSQEKLLSLVAERLIDSNSNIDNKDTGYVENQQQNISDAIDLLPRLTTGIDVNIKFRRIDDFEFTPECAIFDLLDIPLYHGWIVDPQDHETAEAIGSKSYNTLMAELVSLETHIESKQEKTSEDDDVDFVAATTAALGVPSPSLSRGQSFDECSPKARKGDVEEEAELLRVLKLSEMERSNTSVDSVVPDVNFHQSTYVKTPELLTCLENGEKNVTNETLVTGTAMSTGASTGAQISFHLDTRTPKVVSQEVNYSVLKDDQEKSCIPLTYEESRKSRDIALGIEVETDNKKVQPVSLEHDFPSPSGNSQDNLNDDYGRIEDSTASNLDETKDNQNVFKAAESTGTLTAGADLDSSNGQLQHTDEHEPFSSGVDGSEPIYEGEERILDSGTVVYENREPVYEGEVVLAEQGDRGHIDDEGLNSQERLSVKQGEIIRNFMKTSASQLTVYGLFCLQDKVKERELCVFFRNNHFNTMFKYEGQLYILATDQGYSNQPDLVWEKLNEVNGDTVYMTSNFKEFKMDDNSNTTWDEQNAMACSADYLSSIDNTQANSSFNSDLQLAMALQQQEYEQQQQQQQQQQQHQQQQKQQQQRNVQQTALAGASKLITGPQVPRSGGKYSSSSSSSSSSKQDSKSKEKCIVM